MRAPAGVTVAVVLALGLGAKLARGLEAYALRHRPPAASMAAPDAGAGVQEQASPAAPPARALPAS